MIVTQAVDWVGKRASTPVLLGLGLAGGALVYLAYRYRSSSPKLPPVFIPTLKDNFIVEYVTDVEGNWEYWRNYVDVSKILSYKGPTLELARNGILVFGGDTVDKGCGDIRFVKDLVRLKRQHPNRVIFILGNRDLNKLRFAIELAEGHTGDMVDVYWDKKHKPYLVYCKEENLDPKSSLTTLKWMLAHTMGSATTFEQRRRELSMEEGAPVTEEDVLRSFRNSVLPTSEDPWMLEFIRYGQLAARVGDCLFVHGGVKPEHLGYVPGSTQTFDRVDEWIAELNDWKRRELDDYEVNFAIRQPQALLDYGVPGGAGGRTVIYSSFLNNGNCEEVSEDVERFLLTQGIRCIFSGHQPHGECPSVIRTRNNLQVFMCDTSFSDMGAKKDFNPANNRGDAVSAVIITNKYVQVYGRLKDSSDHEYFVHRMGGELPDLLVGRKLLTGHWVKTLLADRDKPFVVVCKGEGFKLDVQTKTVDEVILNLAGGHELRV